MNRKLARLLQPSFQLYFVCLVLFALISAFFSIPLAVVELAAILALAVYSRQHTNRCRREIARYLENVTGTVDTATKDTMANSPLPMIIFRPESDDIIWTNDRFLQLTGEREHLFDAKLSALIPGFDSRWLMEGKTECPTEVEYGSRRFLVFGHLVRTGGRSGGFLATTYWVDVTEFSLIRERYQATRPVAAVLLLDNYDELTNNMPDVSISALNAQLNSRISDWADSFGGMLRKLERNRFLLLFEAKDLARMADGKFSLLESVRSVTSPSGIPATVSIGIGKDGVDFREDYDFAALSIEMALSRGGDQAVIKDRYDFTFFGGRTKQTERRTKVKSRVMASSLSELITQSSRVFIMGHKMADLDALGAAAGVACLCRKKGKKANIVMDPDANACGQLLAQLQPLAEYHDLFLTGQEALLAADPKSLLVVVDTNRPDQVECKPLLESIRRIVVIDHHRRAADYIDQAVLNMHEPFASSASELVTELLQYAVDATDILPQEAAALLAGIVLDTKNFGVRTSSRTFEAAAFLRRIGADTVAVKKLFQNDLSATVARYRIIQNARLYRGSIAIAALDYTVTRTLAAQAADELLNISGIDTSFVLYPQDGVTYISARSLGDANVQVILEPLGGGGNAATAGAQVKNHTVQQTLDELLQSINKFYES